MSAVVSCFSPGVAESPLMTWGEIESTPFRLDGSDTPLVERGHGPSFKVQFMSTWQTYYIHVLVYKLRCSHIHLFETIWAKE